MDYDGDQGSGGVDASDMFRMFFGGRGGGGGFNFGDDDNDFGSFGGGGSRGQTFTFRFG